MFDKNKDNDKEEDTYPPVIAKKATKLALKNNKTKKISFDQTTPEGYSTSDSDPPLMMSTRILVSSTLDSV